MPESADIGVTGLGVMGRNLARNLARRGHRVALHNRTAAKVDDLMERFGHEGTFVAARSLEELADHLERPHRILVMVQAGEPTDEVIAQLVPHLDSGDIILDGGNAWFEDTRRRCAELAARGIELVGTGISGGEEGALDGPSIMPGGSPEAYGVVGPMLEDIAARVDGTPCCTHVGPDGAGHFVKMVHNGIEYADMQLIAEAYDLLRQALGLAPAELAAMFADWNGGDLESFLIHTTAEVLARVDPATKEAFVDVVLDRAGQKGTGRWTVRSALDLGLPESGIAEAVFARSLSGHGDQRDAARRLPGPSGRLRGPAAERLADDVRHALYASKVVAYAQGFDHLAAGSDAYGWDVGLAAMAGIWRGGCIIRARFLDRIRMAYESDPHIPSLLLDDYFTEAVGAAQQGWRRVVATAASLGVPTPGFASSLSYYDALRRDRLPAALIQGLRDYFGAHTYARTDRAGTFHVEWSGTGAEVEVMGGT